MWVVEDAYARGPKGCVIVNGHLQDDVQIWCEVIGGSASVGMDQMARKRRDARGFGGKRREDGNHRCMICAAGFDGSEKL